MASAPEGPVEDVVGALSHARGQSGEQATSFGNGDSDQAGLLSGVAARDGCQDGEERVSEHRQGGPSVPGVPAPDLVLVETDDALGGLEVSSMRHRCPATRTRVRIGTGLGAWHRW